MRPMLFLLPSMLFGLTVPAESADRQFQACRTVATMLRAGSGNTVLARRQTLLETLARNSRGRLSLARWQDLGDQRAAYLRAAGMQPATGLPVTAALSADRLVAVKTEGGSAGCIDVSLFHSVGHRLVQIVPPYVAAKLLACERWGDSIFLGSLDGRPFVAKEFSGDSNIPMASWNGQSWDPACTVVVTYVPKLSSEATFCRAADCAKAEAQAKHIAAQLLPDGEQRFPYKMGNNAQMDHLVELANNTPDTNTIPDSTGLLGPDTTLLSPVPNIIVIDGRPTLAIAGVWKRGPAPQSEPIGYAVAFWQEIRDKLTSVAGFHLRVARSTIKSVLVTR